jgi:carbon-monoxide dehydrogenase medium subunit
LGTIGGSLCHADPVSDYPAAVVAADAVILVQGPDGARRIPATEFFKDFLTTDLAPGEIMVAVELPAPLPGSTGHYLKYARVDGDYTTVSVALTLALQGGACTHARIVLGACGPVPIQSPDAEAVLIGSRLSVAAIGEAGTLLAAASKPLDDVRGSAQYRRHIIPNLVKRAVLTAQARLA